MLRLQNTDITLAIVALLCLASYVGLNNSLKQSKLEAREQAQRLKMNTIIGHQALQSNKRANSPGNLSGEEEANKAPQQLYAVAGHPYECQRFIILSSQRTGSTWFVDLLRQHPEVRVGHDEAYYQAEGLVDNPYMRGLDAEELQMFACCYLTVWNMRWPCPCNSEPQSRKPSNDSLLWEDYRAHLENAFRSNEHAMSGMVGRGLLKRGNGDNGNKFGDGPGYKAIGFKIMYNQIPTHLRRQFFQWVKETNTLVIHFIRQTKILSYTSLRGIVDHGEQWHSPTKPKRHPVIFLPTKQASRYVASVEAMSRDFHKELHGLTCSHDPDRPLYMDIVYEGLLSGSDSACLDSVWQHLGVSPRQQAMQWKQRSGRGLLTSKGKHGHSKGSPSTKNKGVSTSVSSVGSGAASNDLPDPGLAISRNVCAKRIKNWARVRASLLGAGLEESVRSCESGWADGSTSSWMENGCKAVGLFIE